MLKTIGTYILLMFGLIANAASIAGFWLSYASAPLDLQTRFGRLLLLLGGLAAPITYLAVAGLLFYQLRKPKTTGKADVALRSAEERITKLEHELAHEQARKELDLPASRPKIVPVRWGASVDRRYGLFMRNDGEPAFDISMEPISVGTSHLGFWDRTYPGLTKSDGELLIESDIRLAHGGGTTGAALRDEMIRANLESLILVIRYRDLDNCGYTTTFELVREFWGDGLRVSSIQQQRLPKLAT